MEEPVLRDERLRVHVRHGAIENGVNALQLLDLRRRHPGRGQARRVPFHLRAEFVDLLDVLGADLGDQHAAMVEVRHQPLDDQALDRLADGRAPDLHLVDQAALGEHRAGRQLQHDDLVHEGLVRLLGQRGVRLDLHPRRVPSRACRIAARSGS